MIKGIMMYIFKKIKKHVAIAMLLSCVSMAFAADVEILPVESTEQLRTRGVGLQDFLTKMPTEQQLASCDFASALESDDPLDPKAGSIYLRMMWQHFEPAEGEYAWDKLDRVLECAHENGQSIDLRVMLTYPGNKSCNASQLALDPECTAYESLPSWLVDRVSTHTTSVFSSGEYQVPDWSDTLFIEKHTALITAMGEKYNNHPDLSSVDIGSVGLWGEWHIHGDSQYMPTLEQQKAIINVYADAFPDTPLVALADSFYQEAGSELGELSVYLRDTLPTGWRGDSWGLPYFNDERYQPINLWMPDSWQKTPVSIEVTDVMSTWLGSDNTNTDKQETKDIQFAIDDALSWHVSQLNLKNHAIPELFKPQLQTMAKKMGFRLVLRKATLSESFEPDTALSVGMTWENVGIAPPYRDFRIALRLKNAEGIVKTQTISEQSVKGWLPDQAIDTTTLITLPDGSAPGSYSLDVALVFNSAADRTLPIAVEGRTEDNWYSLGTIELNNQAPIVADTSMTLRADQQASVILNATDPENQTLSYQVTQAPEHGQLLGDLPNTVYVADDNHPGEDSFSYTVNDGESDSKTATVSIDVFPVITEGSASSEQVLGTINVDGNRDDWADIASFGIDGDDLTNPVATADWQEAWMAHDDQRLYIAYQNNDPIDTLNLWQWSVFLDTDPNSGIGFKVNNNVSADFILNGGNLLKYTGSGSDWSWEYVAGAADSTIQSDFAELSILRSAMDNPSEVRALFRADNSAQVGTYLVDNFPNGTDGFFTYMLNEGAVNGILTEEVTNELSAPLNIDGDLADWATIPSFGSDGDDITEANSQADILEAWMAHDATDFYIAYVNDGDINTVTMWPWQIFLDTDRHLSTGFSSGVGAEFMIQGRALYEYAGTGSDWTWQYVQSVTSEVVGEIAEFKIPLSALGMPSALHSILIARNSPFIGNNSASGIDRYPDQGIGHLSYRFNDWVSNPVENPPSIDALLDDWAATSLLESDGDDVTAIDSQADFLEARLAHDTENLYVAFTNDGPINQSIMWPWQIFFDTDEEPTTGYQPGDGFGGEFMLQGRVLYKYIGTGTDWSWETVTTPLESAVVDDTAEFKIPRISIDNTAATRVLFRASNWPFNNSFAYDGYDYLPNSSEGSALDSIRYDMSQ